MKAKTGKSARGAANILNRQQAEAIQSAPEADLFGVLSKAIRLAHPHVVLRFVDADKRLEVELGLDSFAFVTPRNAVPAWPVVAWKEEPGVDWRDRGGWECHNVDDVLTVLRWPIAEPSRGFTSVNEIRDKYENPAKHDWVHAGGNALRSAFECRACKARIYVEFGETIEEVARMGHENWRERKAGTNRKGPLRALTRSMGVAAIPPQCPGASPPTVSGPPNGAKITARRVALVANVKLQLAYEEDGGDLFECKLEGSPTTWLVYIGPKRVGVGIPGMCSWQESNLSTTPDRALRWFLLQPHARDVG